MKAARKIITAAAVIMLICGIALISYPYVSQYIFQKHANEEIEVFISEAAKMKEASASLAEGESDPLEALYSEMQKYNEKLYREGQSGISDPFTYEEPSFDLTSFGFAENIIGYIEIPKIDVRLPIYLGASKENMDKGAVHLTKSSLPIGGENTNAVIAAHRGSLIGLMFRNIHKLEIGDELYITNFRETLTYKITETAIIRPSETDKVLIRPGEDMLTLSTCHPLGTNTQRYIVYAKREG